MDWTTHVAVHESAAPARIRSRILEALGRRAIDPFLLYSGLKQTSLWIALHQAISPARLSHDVSSLYQKAFEAASTATDSNPLHVVSLGCGDGSKDAECLRACRSRGKTVLYTPCDISLEMALTAHQLATKSLPGLQCAPVLCDLLECTTLPGILKSLDPSGMERIILFLGTIHNYSPEAALRALLPITRSSDRLILSANLAPAESYEGHLACILTQYDNEATRRWLLGALGEMGISPRDGTLEISVADSDDLPGLKQIEARFVLTQPIHLEILGEKSTFDAGESLSIFASRRFTLAHIRDTIKTAGLEIAAEWSLDEEGVWICQRQQR